MVFTKKVYLLYFFKYSVPSIRCYTSFSQSKRVFLPCIELFHSSLIPVFSSDSRVSLFLQYDCLMLISVLFLVLNLLPQNALSCWPALLCNFPTSSLTHRVVYHSILLQFLRLFHVFLLSLQLYLKNVGIGTLSSLSLRWSNPC